MTQVAGMILNVPPDQLQAIVSEGIARGVESVLRLMPKGSNELPISREKCMEYLNLKDIKAFNRRAKEMGAKAKGTIGKQPAYYLSDFFDPK